jgi:hypothetical protein
MSVLGNHRRSIVKGKLVNCLDCGTTIPESRLEWCPDTEYCVDCADQNSEPIVARVIYSHKCDCDLFIAKGKENVRRLNREYARAR